MELVNLTPLVDGVEFSYLLMNLIQWRWDVFIGEVDFVF